MPRRDATADERRARGQRERGLRDVIGGIRPYAVAKCIDEPLLKEKGIKVITETPGGYAKLAAQAKSGVINNVSTDGSTSELSRMAAEGRVTVSLRRSIGGCITGFLLAGFRRD